MNQVINFFNLKVFSAVLLKLRVKMALPIFPAHDKLSLHEFSEAEKIYDIHSIQNLVLHVIR